MSAERLRGSTAHRPCRARRHLACRPKAQHASSLGTESQDLSRSAVALSRRPCTPGTARSLAQPWTARHLQHTPKARCPASALAEAARRAPFPGLPPSCLHCEGNSRVARALGAGRATPTRRPQSALTTRVQRAVPARPLACARCAQGARAWCGGSGLLLRVHGGLEAVAPGGGPILWNLRSLRAGR